MTRSEKNPKRNVAEQSSDAVISGDHPTRRDALKTVAATMAFGAAGLGSFGTAAAMLDKQTQISPTRSLDKSHWVSGHEGILVFVDDWDGVPSEQMRAVSFLNTSSQSVTLDHVNPGLLRADGQVFDLNHILASGPIELTPEQTRSFGLFPVDASRLDTLMPARANAAGTLVHATPHTVVADGWRQTTQYAVIA